MAESTCLHIQDHDAGPIRIVEVPWISVRIGRAAFCEVRLTDPSLPEEACRLHRRGRTWHLTPLGGSDVSLDGRPIDGPRPLPFDVAFQVGGFRLALKRNKFAEPDWRPPRDEPRGRAGREPLAEAFPEHAAPPTTTEPTAAAPAPDLGNPWEARWQAAGDRLKAARAVEARPAPTPSPAPAAAAPATPPRPAPSSPRTAARRPNPLAPPRPASSRSPGRERRSSRSLRSRPGSSRPPTPGPSLPPRDRLAPVPAPAEAPAGPPARAPPRRAPHARSLDEPDPRAVPRRDPRSPLRRDALARSLDEPDPRARPAADDRRAPGFRSSRPSRKPGRRRAGSRLRRR
ncbi:FHA domain-containing protein [Planctomyces sp. SH-PL62]|uniref:FHA domain-containing protein n=1 Tax=Planctomyces sp. SH-PL62 TaxID=1636152 RepID=UPI00078C537E|nr:FHA domain-containing protein [Planctomyces sp. SH-PL62]AMV35807.1 hypothetical protein VT85_00085 [Planctomyces sp. SH-PL62]